MTHKEREQAYQPELQVESQTMGKYEINGPKLKNVPGRERPGTVERQVHKLWATSIIADIVQIHNIG